MWRPPSRPCACEETPAVLTRVLILAALLAAAPAGASAQVFLAERPHPEFTIGPLFVRGAVTPGQSAMRVELLWSLVIPATRSAADIEQDLFLLWPGEVTGPGAIDEGLSRFVEERGFTVLGAGRLELVSRNLFQMDSDVPPTPVPGGAPYVTFVRAGGVLGLTAPVALIRIPWTPYQVNRARLMELAFSVRNVVRPRQATWVENVFWGPRHLVTLSFHDVRQRGLFPLYFERRDHVVRLAEDPSQLLLEFRNAERVKIEQVTPPGSRRQLSETSDSTEVVSLFLDRSEGLTPQVLTVQFGYFTGWRAWAPVVIPTAFFVLGNLAAPLIRVMGERTARFVRTRLSVARPRAGSMAEDRGVVIPAETLARLVPGTTTEAEVRRLCGDEAEVVERRGTLDERTLVYRGRHLVPDRRPLLGWLAHVSRWTVEDHEVAISMVGGLVSDVQARVRRAQRSSPDAA